MTHPLPSPAPGVCVYAIGDIHGRIDLLEQLVDMIAHDAATQEGRKILVGLGDYIDRGPASKDVIDYLSRLDIPGTENVFLRGNHEELAARFIEGDTSNTPAWLRYGGMAFLASYGADPFRPGALNNLPGLSAQFAEKFPASHRAFFASMRSSFTCGDYYFAHAGVHPDTPLEAQTSQDLLWIRDTFLSSDKDFGKVIVHGHTISPEPDVRPNRIGIDTGAFATGRLTCLKLWQTERHFFST